MIIRGKDEKDKSNKTFVFLRSVMLPCDYLRVQLIRFNKSRDSVQTFGLPLQLSSGENKPWKVKKKDRHHFELSPDSST